MAREEFDAFAVSEAPRLYRAAYLMVGDHYLAEDLVQDVLARVYVAWPKILSTPRGYSYRALANAVANERRWGSRHPTAPLVADLPAVGDAADGAVAHADVLSALHVLPPRQRVVVVLRYYVDLTEAETADALHISVGTVKSQHARALARMRTVLGGDIAPAGTERPGSDADPEPLLDRSTP